MGGHSNSSSSDILLNQWIRVVVKCLALFLDQQHKADTLLPGVLCPDFSC